MKNATSKSAMATTGNQVKKSTIPVSIGIASVWFGTHVGPGTASGKQVAVYYSQFGKMGIFLPVIAMSLLGLSIFYALEYSRKNDLHDFKSFTNKFFYPYEKIFGVFFEITFLLTCLLAPGACIATAASLLELNFGIGTWIGTGFIVVVTLFMTVYGEEIVKSIATVLTVGILVALAIIAILGIKSAPNFSVEWHNPTIVNVSIWSGIWSAITYAGFQATGNLGNVISVSKGLKTKKDSIKATILGIILNVLLLSVMVLLHYGYQPDSINNVLPNFYVVQQLALPLLTIVYVALVLFASLSTIIGFCIAVTARYGKFVKIENEKKRNLTLISGLLILDVAVSSFGLAAIVNVGFRYLGYLSLPLVLVPFLFVGYKKYRRGEVKDN